MFHSILNKINNGVAFEASKTTEAKVTWKKKREDKVRSCYGVSITSNQAAKKILLEVKTITKSPGNGIAESVKSCNLHKKGRILWF